MNRKLAASYLHKAHNNIYYFRVRIPQSIRLRYRTAKTEIKKSLGTRDFSTAIQKARYLWVQMQENDYDFLENKIELENEERQLLRDFLIASLEEEMSSYFSSYFYDDKIETPTQEFISSLSKDGFEALQNQIEQWNSLPKKYRDSELKLLKDGIVKASIPDKKNEATAKHANESKTQTTLALVKDKIKEFTTSHFEKRERTNSPLSPASKMEYISYLDEFLSIIGSETKMDELSKEVLRKYQNTLWEIPANYSRKKEYKNLSIEQLLEKNIPKDHKRSVNTVNKITIRIVAFLDWAEHEGYITEPISYYLETLKEKGNSNEKRDSFTDKELALLFHNDLYEQGKFEYPSDYWLPLLALYTGARGNELAQLYKDNVIIDDETKIPYLHIKEEETRNQNIKTKSAIRFVPLHDKLISLGFLEYIESISEDSMIFPELKPTSETQKPFKKFGNKFNRKSKYGFKYKCGVTRDKVSFHSFRHNVIDFLEKTSTREKVICELVGHKYKGEGLVENYIKREKLSELKKAINKLEYKSIDWRKIKERPHWGKKTKI